MRAVCPPSRLENLERSRCVDFVGCDRLGDRAGNRRPSRQVHDGLTTGQGSVEKCVVEDRSLHQFDGFEAGEVLSTARTQIVEDCDSMRPGERSAEVGTNESGATGHDDFHALDSTAPRWPVSGSGSSQDRPD